MISYEAIFVMLFCMVSDIADLIEFSLAKMAFEKLVWPPSRSVSLVKSLEVAWQSSFDVCIKRGITTLRKLLVLLEYVEIVFKNSIPLFKNNLAWWLALSNRLYFFICKSKRLRLLWLVNHPLILHESLLYFQCILPEIDLRFRKFRFFFQWCFVQKGTIVISPEDIFHVYE